MKFISIDFHLHYVVTFNSLSFYIYLLHSGVFVMNLCIFDFEGQRHLFDVLSGRVFADEKPVSRTIRLFISSNPIGMVTQVRNMYNANINTSQIL